MVALNVQVISVQFFRSYSLKLMLRTYLISIVCEDKYEEN